MKPASSAVSFQEFLAQRHLTASQLAVPQLVESTLSFYQSVRASGLAKDPQSDMLLFQWGVFDWGHGERFEFDVTRQFIVSADFYPLLVGQRIRLRPLEEDDADVLLSAASDGELWNLPFTVIPSIDTIGAYISTALNGRNAGTVLPFITEDLASGCVIGSTRFWKIDRQNRKLEIGHTWLSASWQRTYANTEAKLLMLRYAFEVMNCVRVQFTTDEINEKSRKAILRLGAVQEGIVRHERIMPNGRKRNSVRFSIIDDEWPGVRTALEQRLQFEE